MSYNCPTCQRLLYNRRLKHCGFCGAQIPESLRFTPEEITARIIIETAREVAVSDFIRLFGAPTQIHRRLRLPPSLSARDIDCQASDLYPQPDA